MGLASNPTASHFNWYSATAVWNGGATIPLTQLVSRSLALAVSRNSMIILSTQSKCVSPSRPWPPCVDDHASAIGQIARDFFLSLWWCHRIHVAGENEHGYVGRDRRVIISGYFPPRPQIAGAGF